MFIFGLSSTSDNRLSNPSKKTLTKTQKNKKGPLSHQKIKCSFLDNTQLLMIGQAIQAKMSTEMYKNEKGPLSHQKIKCSFLDYIQLLMISWAIRAKNVDLNAKKQKRPPKSSKNKMFIFALCSTLMIGQAIQAKNVDQTIKKQKRPPKSSKNKMFIFGLRSTSDDRPSDPSKIHQPKCKKNEKGPLSHQKIKCSFLDYVQLPMIGRVIQAKNIDRNAKKQKRPPKSSKNKMFIFGLHSTSDDQPSDPSKKHRPKCKKTRKAP